MIIFSFPFNRQDNHPVLVSARQTAANQILLTYDRRTDVTSGLKVTNYWIRSNAGPNAAASVDMGEALSTSNSIRPDMATMMLADNTNMHFLMTFRNNIPPRTLYVVLPCYVNAEGETGFTGANWGPYSMNMFIGM